MFICMYMYTSLKVPLTECLSGKHTITLTFDRFCQAILTQAFFFVDGGAVSDDKAFLLLNLMELGLSEGEL